MNKVFLSPSFYANLVNAFFIFIAGVLVLINYSKILNLEPYKLIALSLLFSISIGIHGLSHLGLEQNYNYNPLSIICNL